VTAAAKKKTAVEPYDLAPPFERAVAAALCQRRQLFDLIGREIAIDRIKDPVAALAIRAAQEHAKETGRGPGDARIVVQRINSWRVEGNVTHEQVVAVYDMLEEEYDSREHSDEAMLGELVPAVRKVVEFEAVAKAIELSGKGKSLAPVKAEIERAGRIGVRERAAGVKMGAGSFDRLRAARAGERLSLGVPEFDVRMNGGLPRKKVGLAIAGTKVGKSMWLAHQSAVAMRLGHFVLCATTELEEEEQEARIIANHTGFIINEIMACTKEAEVTAALEPMLPLLGSYRVKKFTQNVSTFSDVEEWVKEEEEIEGRKCDLLVVDYIDEVSVDGAEKFKSSHEIEARAMGQFKRYVEQRELWGWTATAAARTDKKNRHQRVDTDDAGGSLKKVKIADAVVTISRNEHDDIMLFMAGSRVSGGRFEIGPFTPDWNRARIVPIVGHYDEFGAP